MARHCQTEGMRERQEMRNHSTEGKYDLVWVDEGGCHHICRYPTKEDVREAKNRMSDPSEELQDLVGIPAEPILEIIPR